MNPNDYQFGDTIETTVGVNAEDLTVGDVIEYGDTKFTVTATRDITTIIGPRIEVEADNRSDDTHRIFHFFRGGTVWLVITDSAL